MRDATWQGLYVCNRCGEPLHFVVGEGWLHPDGKLVRTAIVNGRERDMHVALPVRPDRAVRRGK